MTMPHTKRPRRNRVNKLRAKRGLPPLTELPEAAVEVGLTLPVGVTTLMVPLPMPIRAVLTKVRLAAQLKDPTIKASDQLFAGAILTGILPALLEQSSAPLIAAPTKANLEQAHKVGKILARPFHG